MLHSLPLKIFFILIYNFSLLRPLLTKLTIYLPPSIRHFLTPLSSLNFLDHSNTFLNLPVPVFLGLNWSVTVISWPLWRALSSQGFSCSNLKALRPVTSLYIHHSALLYCTSQTWFALRQGLTVSERLGRIHSNPPASGLLSGGNQGLFQPA